MHCGITRISPLAELAGGDTQTVTHCAGDKAVLLNEAEIVHPCGTVPVNHHLFHTARVFQLL